MQLNIFSLSIPNTTFSLVLYARSIPISIVKITININMLDSCFSFAYFYRTINNCSPLKYSNRYYKGK